MDTVYVVMWESFDGEYRCEGGNLYMSLDEDKANAFRDKAATTHEYFTYTWEPENDMWATRGAYGSWDKIYTVAQELDKEIGEG